MAKKRRQPKRSSWVSTTAAAEQLGCSIWFLYDQRGRLFRAGTHYQVLNPAAWRPTYRWHIENCRALMAGPNR